MFIKSVGAVIGLALLSTTALAADLPSRRAPPVYAPAPPIPVFTWTGVYVGGQIGYEFGRDSAVTSGLGLRTGGQPKGVIGGAHIGYNFSTQGLPVFGGVLGTGGVFGIEGDVDGSSARSNYAFGVFNAVSRDQIQGSVRGRVGVAVDRVLFYATGGAAFGSLKNTYTNIGTAGFIGATDSINKTRVGYTVGGGVEYALTNNWSVRAEYRYTDFGSYTDNLVVSSPAGVSVRHRYTDNRVQAGFSYKFDTFAPVAPVVARY